MLVKRLLQLLKRRKAAAKLGITFERSSTFHLPEKLFINGQLRNIRIPNEIGVQVAFVELLLDDCYKCGKLKRSSQHIKTVLDIGANVGLFGIAARIAFPTASIHSYEPNPSLEEFLSAQAQMADFDFFMEAVGLENGRVTLDFNPDSVLTRSMTDVSGDIHKPHLGTQ